MYYCIETLCQCVQTSVVRFKHCQCGIRTSRHRSDDETESTSRDRSDPTGFDMTTKVSSGQDGMAVVVYMELSNR